MECNSVKILKSYMELNPYPISKRNKTHDDSFYFYLIYSDITDLYKIGITSHLLDRIRNMSNMAGIRLKYLYIGEPDLLLDESSNSIEKFLHSYFKQKRFIGEWFKLTKRDLVEFWQFVYSIDIEPVFDCRNDINYFESKSIKKYLYIII